MSIGQWCNENGYTFIYHFQVLHKGWEMDNDGWIVEDKTGLRHAVLQSHGLLYIAKKSEFYTEYAKHIAAAEGFDRAKMLIEGARK